MRGPDKRLDMNPQAAAHDYLNNEPPASALPAEQETAKVLLRWAKEGQNIGVMGSWDAWVKLTPLSRQSDAFGRGYLYSTILQLPPGRHHFNFIFPDGSWRYEPSYLFETEPHTGALSNYVDVRSTDADRLVEPKRLQSCVSLSGPEARYFYETASEAISGSRPTCPDKLEAQESLLRCMTLHERRDLAGSIAEFGLSVEERGHSYSPPPVPQQHSQYGMGFDNSYAPSWQVCIPNGMIPLEESKSPRASQQMTNLPHRGRVGTSSSASSLSSLDVPSAAVTALPHRRSVCKRRKSTVVRRWPQRGVIRSRSLTDLETVQREWAGTDSLSARFDRKQAARLRQSQESSCAAVGSCLVQSSVKRSGKLLLCMVGLPGRGKTGVAKALRRHLEWMGLKVGWFCSTEHRRNTFAEQVSSEFFDPSDAEAWSRRSQIAAEVVTYMVEELKNSIDIAVFDAGNCTAERRAWLGEAVKKSGLYAQVIFIECICTQPQLFESNIRQIILRSPEYRGLSQEEAFAEFHRKNEHYHAIYETVEESEDFPFLKTIDCGRKLISYRITGYIPGRVMLLLANLNLQPRHIWMSRHGESVFNAAGKIGGDSPLSARGMIYAKKLDEFIRNIYHLEKDGQTAGPLQRDLVIWTSTMLRTGQTVAELNRRWEVIKWRALDEIEAGVFDGLTYEEMAEKFPEEYSKRKQDKFNYRYPRGESYQDCFLRLEPLVFEMLRQTQPLLIVGHQAILRILYGYLVGKRPDECCELAMPLHTVISLLPQAYACEESWHSLAKETDGGNI